MKGSIVLVEQDIRRSLGSWLAYAMLKQGGVEENFSSREREGLF
jgi:hypothetical protein